MLSTVLHTSISSIGRDIINTAQSLNALSHPNKLAENTENTENTIIPWLDRSFLQGLLNVSAFCKSPDYVRNLWKAQIDVQIYLTFFYVQYL